MKICRNCKHWGSGRYVPHNDYCYRNIEVNINVVTGHKAITGKLFCLDERTLTWNESKEKTCGKEGRFYQKKWWRFWE